MPSRYDVVVNERTRVVIDTATGRHLGAAGAPLDARPDGYGTSQIAEFVNC